jgi:putative phosphoesterase
MKKIGIISDTHGSFSNDVCTFFGDVDEIWHAGDIGNIGVADEMVAFKPLCAVHGNIDGEDVRRCYPQVQRFVCEKVDVLMTHIGGFVGHYDRGIRDTLYAKPPKLFVCGHSHILRVMYDKGLQMLCVNPGAAGDYGIHKVRTAIKLVIDGSSIRDMEIGEWQRTSHIL